MKRLALWCLLGVACERPAASDPEIAGPCANPYLPIALGNHWEYDLSGARGTPVGSVTLDVVAVDKQNRRVTLRSVESHQGRAGTPDFFTLACTKGGVAALPHLSSLRDSPDSPAALPARADIERSDYHWTARSFQQVVTREGPLRADVTGEGRRAPVSRVKVPAGEYTAIELDQHIQVALSNGQQHSGDAQLFVASNVGVVRAIGAQRVISLRRFRPRMRVSGPPPPPLPPPAQPLTSPPPGCSCEPCSDQWGHNKSCKQCKWCDCHPIECGCPGQPACVPGPVCETTECLAPGLAGMNAESCPRHAGFFARVAAAELCRDSYWDSPLGILSALGILGADDVCGRSWVGNDEWEVMSEGEAVGRVAGTPTRECDNPSQGCDESAVCGATKRSSEDLCFSHHDGDYEFNLAIDPSSPAMRYVAPLNLIPNDDHPGGDIGVEWEYSFMFPPHTDAPSGDLKISVPVSVHGQSISLSVPWPGDIMAVHGALISDCGHPCGDGNHARTEFHPPTAMAWLHPLPGKAGHYRLSWRASSHGTFPLENPTRFRGTLHSSLPLSDLVPLVGSHPGVKRLGKLMLEGQTTCDYLFKDWDFVDLDGCKHLVDVFPYLCDPQRAPEEIVAVLGSAGVTSGLSVLAFAAWFDSRDPKGFLLACRGQPRARLENGSGDCARWTDSFNLQISSASDGGAVVVALDPKVSAPADRPDLFGGHVDVCAPICARASYCGPSQNGCGFCTGSYCDQPNVACGAPVPNCGGATCQRGVCPNSGECVAGHCVGCQCGNSCGGPDGCGGICRCASGSVCIDDHCVHACRSGETMCPDGTCRPNRGACP
jgi:hypothetical protein